jgi:hypothetical protein
LGSGSNPLKKTPLPPGEGNIRISGFDPPPIFDGPAKSPEIRVDILKI